MTAGAPSGRPLVVVAERAAWIRVYQDNGTVIFERILEKGETYSPPEGIEAPLIWAGNSGSVYVRVGDTLHGPLGSGTRAAKDVRARARSRSSSTTRVVEDVPEVISQAFGAAAGRGAVAAGRDPVIAVAPRGDIPRALRGYASGPEPMLARARSRTR